MDLQGTTFFSILSSQGESTHALFQQLTPEDRHAIGFMDIKCGGCRDCSMRDLADVPGSYCRFSDLDGRVWN